MELLEFSDRTYRIDLGVKDGNMSFRNTLSDLCDNKDDSPIVIMLDEFQHARSLKGKGITREEIEHDKTRMVWELIDSGKVSYIDWKTGLWQFEDLILKLKKLASNGVKVRNGLVTDGLDLYIQEMDMPTAENTSVPFIPKEEYATIIELAGEALHLRLKQDVEKVVMKLNAKASIDFLFNVFRLAQRPTIKNFTKSLIFIIGNIDEAYTMSSNFSSDISADEFYLQSLKITVPDMKGALRDRFRDEQIARLGNTHIIYPA
jgi:cell division protease FtsH